MLFQIFYYLMSRRAHLDHLENAGWEEIAHLDHPENIGWEEDAHLDHPENIGWEENAHLDPSENIGQAGIPLEKRYRPILFRIHKIHL